MGVTIESKRYSCDMGFAGFNRFRTFVAKLVNDEVGKHYEKLNDSSVMYLWGEERADYFRTYDAKTKELVAGGKFPIEIANFLYQSDCEGKIYPKQARMIFKLIKDCDDDIPFGYTGRSDCTRLFHLKRIFSDKTNVYWS